MVKSNTITIKQNLTDRLFKCKTRTEMSAICLEFVNDTELFDYVDEVQNVRTLALSYCNKSPKNSIELNEDYERAIAEENNTPY